ncbi:MAG: archaeal heat shock protein Hsp20 [Desulfurococcaceae archaeon]|jgi:HSP20 family protein
MPDDWWWRRRRRFWEEDIFDELDRMFEEMMRDLRDVLRRFYYGISPEELEREIRELEKRGVRPYVYGFSITIGPDGRPVVREFGNIRRTRGRPEIIEEREPLVDVFERGDEVVVVAEIPGVDKEKIDLKVTEDGKTLIIKASNEERKYYKEVDLPAKVDPESAKASYKNGILEVRLKKIGKEEGKGIKIKVE